MITKNSLRIDKFLWAVRLCKTRKIAYHLCNKKKIKINDIICKPSKIIDKDNLHSFTGDMLLCFKYSNNSFFS